MATHIKGASAPFFVYGTMPYWPSVGAPLEARTTHKRHTKNHRVVVNEFHKQIAVPIIGFSEPSVKNERPCPLTGSSAYSLLFTAFFFYTQENKKAGSGQMKNKHPPETDILSHFISIVGHKSLVERLIGLSPII